MENQHRKISGYRELTQEEIDLMNRIKETGLSLKALCADVYTHISNTIDTSSDQVIIEISEADSIGWAFRGEEDLKKGLMFLTRAIARPKGF